MRIGGGRAARGGGWKMWHCGGRVGWWDSWAEGCTESKQGQPSGCEYSVALFKYSPIFEYSVALFEA